MEGTPPSASPMFMGASPYPLTIQRFLVDKAIHAPKQSYYVDVVADPRRSSGRPWYHIYQRPIDHIPQDCIVEEVIDMGCTDDYVYDLETDFGTFQAGIGNIIVKNTDSVFVKFHVPPYSEAIREGNPEPKMREMAIAESFRLGSHAADAVTAALFHPPIKLEFEKVYCPLVMIGKKRYIGQLFNEKKGPSKPAYMDCKGVELKRRDNCPLVKEVYQHIIDVIVSHGGHGGLEEAKAYVKDKMQALMAGDIPMEKLIITKTLKSGYKSPNIAHKVLADRIAQRSPGSEPRINDRVPFIYVDIGNPAAKQFEIVEDPEWAKEHDLPINALYYLEHQLRTPIVQFLGTISPDITDFIDGIIATAKGKKMGMNKGKGKGKALLPGQTLLNSYFSPVLSVSRERGVASSSSSSSSSSSIPISSASAPKVPSIGVPSLLIPSRRVDRKGKGPAIPPPPAPRPKINFFTPRKPPPPIGTSSQK